MRNFIIYITAFFTLTGVFSTCAYGEELELGGTPVGIRINTEGVTVAGFSNVETDSGSCSPAESAGIQQGDRITMIGDVRVDSASQISSALEDKGGDGVDITLEREGKLRHISVAPSLSCDGRWMLGLLLREGVTGIGTVTFVDPDSGIYGALGHGISEESTGQAIPITGGTVCQAQIVDVCPGSPGVPGELNGCSDTGAVVGTVEKNTPDGIFGQMLAPHGGELIELGAITPGPATIVSTVHGSKAEEFSVEINRITSETGTVRAMLTVTDGRLLSITGGIVQGMSGSPVIQNGKLVGAVTHVFVSDPARGCAIGIYDMLAQAGLSDKVA